MPRYMRPLTGPLGEPGLRRAAAVLEGGTAMASESRAATSRCRPAGHHSSMPDSSTILLVDDEESVQKLLTYPLERDGFRVVPARDGEEALARFARGAGRPRRARHHAAEARRARGLQAPARPELGADHHAHGPRRRARQGARARARRRRLHHEAVLDPRVPEPRAGAAAPRVRAAAGRRRRGRSRPAAVTIDLARRDGRASTARTVAAHVRRVRAAAHARRATRAASTPGRRCSRRSGAARTTASRARSTSTSAICARSSSRIRASRS